MKGPRARGMETAARQSASPRKSAIMASERSLCCMCNIREWRRAPRKPSPRKAVTGTQRGEHNCQKAGKVRNLSHAY
ncbi:hypothetical protein JCM10599A_58300 [Paraburkholderia kururiensis]